MPDPMDHLIVATATEELGTPTPTTGARGRWGLARDVQVALDNRLLFPCPGQYAGVRCERSAGHAGQCVALLVF